MDPQQGTSFGQKAQETTGQYAEQAREKTGELAQKAQETAKSTLHQQKGQVAGSVDSLAQALRSTGRNLQDQDQAAFGRVAEQAADRLAQFSDDLQNKSVDEIFDDVQDFARRDPQLFLGGAVVLGLLAARFLKSSSRRRYSQYGQPGFGSQYGTQRYSSQSYRQRPAGSYYSREDLNDYRDDALRTEYTGTYSRSSYTGSGTSTGSAADFESSTPTGESFPAEQDFGAEDAERGYPAGSASPSSFPRETKPGPRSTSGTEGTTNDASDQWA